MVTVTAVLVGNVFTVAFLYLLWRINKVESAGLTISSVPGFVIMLILIAPAWAIFSMWFFITP